MFYKVFCLSCLLVICCICSANAEELCVEEKFCYNVSLMQTPKEQAKGLMFVKSMPENEGMLFDFRKYDSKKIVMWMKNTYISLDMVFIGCDGIIKDIYKEAKPLSLEHIKSDTDYCYVLEINGGEFDKRGMNIGDKIKYNMPLLGKLKAWLL